MDALFHALVGATPWLVYLFLGLGAAVENVLPPVPADTFVLFGGFLAAVGEARAWPVFWVTWGANVASALAVYAAGHRYGRSFFQGRLGRRLLRPSQLERLDRFYERWGVPAIFFARFLPGLRAVVPVFAGVTHQPFRVVVLPVAVASAIWYGALVWIGTTAGENWRTLVGWVQGVNRALLAVALLVGAGIAWWWHRSRTRKHTEGE